MKVRFRKAKDGWRWRVQAANGRIVAESGEAYTRKRDAERGYEKFVLEAPLEAR